MHQTGELSFLRLFNVDLIDTKRNERVEKGKIAKENFHITSFETKTVLASER